MNPFKLVMKFIKALRGGASRRQVYLGVLLGFGVGLIPGVNLTLLLFLLPLIFLNINGPAAALSLILGRILMFALAPVLYYLGFVLIHSLGCGKSISAMADTPVLALLDWHIYAVFGAFVLVLVIGNVLASFISRALFKAQTAMSAAGAAESASKVGKFGRFLLRFMAGKQQEDQPARQPLFRKGRCIAALVIFGIGAAGYFLFLDAALARVMEKAIGDINGAQTDVDSVDLSLSAGKLSIYGLEVTDADKPSVNHVAAGTVTMDISVADLLKRRVVVDEIFAGDVFLSSKRKSPGKVYGKKTDSGKKDTKDQAEEDSLLDTVADSVKGSAGKVVEYVKQVKDVDQKLRKLKKYLKKLSDMRQRQRESTLEDRRNDELIQKGYLRAAAVELLPEKPAWHIVQAKIDNVVLMPHLPGFTIVAKNIASDQDLVEGGMSIIARPDDAVLESLGNAAGEIKDVAENIADNAKDAVEGLADGVGDSAQKAADEAKDALKSLFK